MKKTFLIIIAILTFSQVSFAQKTLNQQQVAKINKAINEVDKCIVHYITLNKIKTTPQAMQNKKTLQMITYRYLLDGILKKSYNTELLRANIAKASIKPNYSDKKLDRTCRSIARMPVTRLRLQGLVSQKRLDILYKQIQREVKRKY